LSRNGAIVVAGNAERIVPAQQRDACLRIGVVADGIAETQDAVRTAPRGVVECRAERFQIGVDIGQDRELHANASAFRLRMSSSQNRPPLLRDMR
jgi:hypothetical protein